jgi:hypothetical protein
MFDQPPACLHQPLLQTRQRPVLDTLGQRQSPIKIAQIVGQQAQRQPYLVRAKTANLLPKEGRDFRKTTRSKVS